jgi:prepilin-type N-terminal cleavage/methylation domain-containing protein/prepilin-type processing-associated H-X9-DG protein
MIFSMDIPKSHRRASAFTLVEMLVVIAIIGILAGLLLPALSRSQMRAKRVWCESNLRQSGIAFQIFAHDHDSKFPMAVSTNNGGSLEFTRSGNLTNVPLYFASRHFQTLANSLDTPKILICPADLRLPARNFSALQNSNVSYFVSVDADYNKPMSVLAGDGNLASLPSLAGFRSEGGVRLRWTREQHQFKGNVLFADAHVEEWGAATSGAIVASVGNLALPSPETVGNSSAVSPSSVGSPSGLHPDARAMPAATTGLGSNASAKQIPQPETPTASQHESVVTKDNASAKSTSSAQIQNPLTNSNPPETSVTINATAKAVSTADDEDSTMSPFDLKVVKVLRRIIGWTYLLLLLMLLMFLAFQIWRWSHKPPRKAVRR